MLPTLIECRTSPELLDSLLHELIGEAATSLRARSHDLFAANNGNLRDVLRALYDEAASSPVSR